MNSIRRHLLVRLLGGVGILWVAFAAVNFFVLRHFIRSRFDAELQAMVHEVRFLLPEGRDLVPRQDAPNMATDWVAFLTEGSGLYFEVWGPDLLFSDTSPSLAGLHLPRPRVPEGPHCWNATLANGEPVRLCARVVGMPVAVPPSGLAGSDDELLPVTIVVARNREGMDRLLGRIAAGSSLLVLLAAAVFAVLVHGVVRDGLRALDRLGRQAAAIDGRSLQERFSCDGLPTELAPIVSRLNELLGRLGESFAREHRFSADLAHELKTPIAELRNLAEVALRWPSPAAGDRFRDVAAIARQLQNLTETLLTLARLETDRDDTPEESVALAEVVQSCWRPCEARALAKGLNVAYAVDPGIRLTTRPGPLRIIIGNLLDNAVDYAPGGSRLEVLSQQDGPVPVLVVANEVEGLTSADIPRMFDRFWRADAARTDAAHVGLGLSLVKACASFLGFSVTARLEQDDTIIAIQLTLTPEGAHRPT